MVRSKWPARRSFLRSDSVEIISLKYVSRGPLQGVCGRASRRLPLAEHFELGVW